MSEKILKDIKKAARIYAGMYWVKPDENRVLVIENAMLIGSSIRRKNQEKNVNKA